MLCSVLAWREHLKYNYQDLKKFEKNGDSLHKRNGIPNIIYSTRTHSQLNQCVQELKCTAYSPKISILGSREQLCVHPKVSLEKGSKQNTKCRSINAPTSNKKCWFKLGSKHMDQITKNILSKHILDVEDLHLIGKDQGFCPYYHSIDNCKDADIIFMPYNYLVDSNIRPPSVNISNSIIIFDEAHNIESICCDSVSFELKAEILAQCIAEVQQILELNKPNDECLASKEDLTGLKKILLKLEEVIEEIPIDNNNKNQSEQPSIIYPGDYIFEILKQAEITMDVKDTILDVAQDVLRELVSPEAEQNASLTISNQSRNSNKYGLETFIKALQTIFGKSFNSDSFKVHLTVKNRQKSHFNVSSSRQLSLWCFNPGLAISGLKNEVHAMILTSGTLSPLQSFSSELQIKFPIRLENKHLIKKEQVYVGVLEKGPCSRILSSEYNVRSTNDYMKELGNSLVNIARRIPYGMLVFFASYKHMEDCVEFWHRNRLGNLTFMEQLEKNKHVVSEPRGGGQAAVKQVFEEYSTALKNNNGAIMFAVMRGKVSEGMDFSDNFARCVVICGIPYPYTKDPKIQEKRNYMDQQCWKHNNNNNNNKNNNNSFGCCVNGQTWYQQQATRAVNQAIGRVIRHRFDYGAIILADRRFSWSKNQQHISSWIRPFIKTVKNFGLLTRDLTQFFKNAKQFDQFMKKPKDKNNKNDRFEFVKVKRELNNISIETNKNEINDMFEAQGMIPNENSNQSNSSNNSREAEFKRYTKKRKFSDTLGNMQRFISTPKETPSSSSSVYNNNINKKRKMNIAYQLNDYDSKPSSFSNNNNNNNNNNLLDVSFHGNTPTVAQKLMKKMQKKALKNAKQHENYMDKSKARKMRLINETQPIDRQTNRKKKQNRVLSDIKNVLSKSEYDTFKSALKMMSVLKKKKCNDVREFDENVVTPFRALFSTPKRRHFLQDLSQYISKEFIEYYEEKLIPSQQNDDNKNNNDDEKISKPRGRKPKQNPNIFIGGQRASNKITLSHGNINRKNKYSKRIRMLNNNNNNNNNNNINNKKDKNNVLFDDSFVKLRKLQDKNANISEPLNRHKRKIKNVTKNNGYNGLCMALLTSDEYQELQKYISFWKKLDKNDINFVSNKKKILLNILNIFINSCRQDIKHGHFSNFRSLSRGFDKTILTKNEDRGIYQKLLLDAPELTEHFQKIRTQQQQTRLEH